MIWAVICLQTMEEDGAAMRDTGDRMEGGEGEDGCGGREACGEPRRGRGRASTA